MIEFRGSALSELFKYETTTGVKVDCHDCDGGGGISLSINIWLIHLQCRPDYMVGPVVVQIGVLQYMKVFG